VVGLGKSADTWYRRQALGPMTIAAALALRCVPDVSSCLALSGRAHPISPTTPLQRSDAHSCSTACHSGTSLFRLSDRDYRVEMRPFARLGGAGFRWAAPHRPAVPALHPQRQYLVSSFLSGWISHQPAATTKTPPFSAPCAQTALQRCRRGSTRSHPALLHRSASEGRPTLSDGALKPSMSAGISTARPLAMGLSDSGNRVYRPVGRNESWPVVLASRQRSFWLVADAAILFTARPIPSAKASSAMRMSPFSPEGTFRIRCRFRRTASQLIRSRPSPPTVSRSASNSPCSFGRSTSGRTTATPPARPSPEWVLS